MDKLVYRSKMISHCNIAVLQTVQKRSLQIPRTMSSSEWEYEDTALALILKQSTKIVTLLSINKQGMQENQPEKSACSCWEGQVDYRGLEKLEFPFDWLKAAETVSYSQEKWREEDYDKALISGRTAWVSALWHVTFAETIACCGMCVRKDTRMQIFRKLGHSSRFFFSKLLNYWWKVTFK